MSASLVGSLSLVLLAIAHSALGERAILQPLFAADWQIGVPRFAADRILRFAWHLTSVAWLALALAWLGVSLSLSISLLGFISALMIFTTVRGHLAWPLFAVVGFSGLLVEGWAAALGAAAVFSGVGVSVSVAALHVYWALGGRWGFDAVLPTDGDGQPLFQPGPLATLAVAGALLCFSGLMGWVWLGQAPVWAKILLGLGCVVMVARAIGDGRQVGFTKQDHSTRFAQWDDALYTPLVVLLAFASAGVLVG
ncbi:MAG: DUF3995 domain-containing protein [Myxococcota bacterium]